MLSTPQYLMKLSMTYDRYDYKDIALKVTETGAGLPHDLRSNYSDMLQLVGTSTEQACL